MFFIIFEGVKSMATRSSFEDKNRERRRRERLRKKRIRTAISLIALTGVIALACVAVSVVNKNKQEAQNYAAQSQATTAAGQEQGSSTVTASIDGKVTGSSVIGANTQTPAQSGTTQQSLSFLRHPRRMIY